MIIFAHIDPFSRYGGQPYLTHARSHTGDEKQAVSPPSPRPPRLPTNPIDGDKNPRPSRPALEGLGQDMPPPSSSSHDNLRATMSQSSTSRPIPHTQPTTQYSTVFDAALRAYRKKTKRDLTTYPLTAILQACDSAAAITAVLQDQEGEGLTMSLGPTVKVLYAWCGLLGEDISLLVNISLMRWECWSDADSADILSGLCWC
jgi:hypothetical protein